MPNQHFIMRWMGVPAILLFLAVSGCGKPAIVEPPPPSQVAIELSATSSINPDAQGRPSPVVVRVYQLADDEIFRKADLNALWSDEQAVLAASLVSRQEFTLPPGGSAARSMPIDPSARLMAVAVAFRDFRSADWRTIAPMPQPIPPGAGLKLSVQVDTRAVIAWMDAAADAGAAK